ncbi:hypothetical protein FHK99_00405 [Cylindrospermopsis raciborskii CS-506_B]|nr:hypothetical protein [Cylindrospermopsis raciborskii]MBA4455103.1 hypothetical protein [Cylindrospermopsis raciborskii CS-506_B]
MNILKGDREALPKGDRIQCSPDSFSREKFEGVEGRSRSTPYGRSLSSRRISCSACIW